MKKLLVVPLLLLAACGQQNASNRNHAPNAQKTAASDTLQVDTSKKFVTGQFDFKTHKDFVLADSQYADKDTYLHKKTYEAFKAMADSAKADSINFTIISGTRNFASQKSIWDRKWEASDSTTALGKAKGILEFSSMPMTSRHHWGTDIDLNNLNNSYFETGQGLEEYEWLKENANAFGFYQPYTDKSLRGRTGYNEEKWHWSYMPLAGPYLKYYSQNVTNKDISGFDGADLAKEINMVKNYVNGVSVEVEKYSR